jgi:hypothetical protein
MLRGEINFLKIMKNYFTRVQRKTIWGSILKKTPAAKTLPK